MCKGNNPLDDVPTSFYPKVQLMHLCRRKQERSIQCCLNWVGRRAVALPVNFRCLYFGDIPG